MNQDKVSAYMGFARKMGKLSYGAGALEELRKKRCYLVLIDQSASENTQKRFISACKTQEVDYAVLPSDAIAEAIGKPNVKTVCIKDAGLANSIMENLDEWEKCTCQN